jgi:hypothetical protein
MHCSIGGIKLGDIFAGGTATVLFVWISWGQYVAMIDAICLSFYTILEEESPIITWYRLPMALEYRLVCLMLLILIITSPKLPCQWIISCGRTRKRCRCGWWLSEVVSVETWRQMRW